MPADVLQVGRRDRTEPHVVRDEDVASGSGVGLALRLLQATAGPTVALTGIRWCSPCPPPVGRSVTLDAVVTRVGTPRTDGTAVVTRHVRLRDGERVLEEGQVDIVVSAAAIRHDVARDFATPGWGQEVAGRLANNEGFTVATSTFDGVIGFAAGSQAVQLRVYRSRVLECVRWTPTGPTFTVAGDELAWLELVEAPRNDYVARAMLGRFTAVGNTYEYLRMTKAVVGAWDVIRKLAGEGSP